MKANIQNSQNGAKERRQFDVNDVRILSRLEVESVTTLSRSAIYEMIKEGTFPRQVRLSANKVGWLVHEVTDWIMQRSNQRDGASGN